MRVSGAGRYIGASELGEFAYCSVSWKMASIGVVRAGGAKRREQGTRWHKGQGRRIYFSGRLRMAGITLVLLALLLIVFAFVLSRGRV